LGADSGSWGEGREGKLKKKGGGKMGFKGLVVGVSLVLLISLGGLCFAADTKNVEIKAVVPQQNSLTVTVSKVTGAAKTPATGVDFGSLVLDTTNNIFTSGGSYYVMDIGVNSNAADWTVTHKTTSVTNGTDTLDDNINVAFMKQTDDATGTDLEKLSYANSNNKGYTKAQLSGGWLRICYSLATGDGSDAPGAVPIAGIKNQGNYQGSITITLTP
jgi:hypothetical protein